MKRATAAVCLIALLTVSCGEGVEPTAIPAPSPVATCVVNIQGQNVTVTGPICGDGNGTVTQPAPTVTPAPTTPTCSKGISRFEGNVVAAETGIPAAQSMESYLVALKRALEDSGFKVATGGALSSDEIAVRNTDEFSETFDFWRADSTPQVLYLTTCRPALK